MELTYSADQSDYIESAARMTAPNASKAYGNNCQSTASCKSCGGGCYGCKGSKGAEITSDKTETGLASLVEAILD